MDNKQISTIISMFVDFFTKGKKTEDLPAPIVTSSPLPTGASTAAVQSNDVLDWNNPKSKISKYFTVTDAIMLRNWNRLATAEDGLNDTVKANLIEIFKKLDIIREYLNIPLYVKSAYRPSAYNVSIGGAKFSAHMASVNYAAVDFWGDINGDGQKDGVDCDMIKAKLMPMLATWGLRMEDNGKGASWVHVDNKSLAPGGSIFFKP